MNDEKKSPQRGMARARPKRSGRSKTLSISRPIMIGLALILAAAAFLFWPRGGGSPAGVGERMSVVTADTGADSMVPDGEPRSGEVTIENETSSLVPESVRSSQASEASRAENTTQTASAPPETEQESKTTENKSVTESKPAATTQTTTPPPAMAQPRSAQKKQEPTAVPKIQPTESGSWAIQVGAFSKEENAQKQIQDLKSRGYPALMHAASAPGGDLLYKVWIGYFKNREEAATYARENRRQIGEAIPVHR